MIRRFTELDHTRIWEHLNQLAGDVETALTESIEVQSFQPALNYRWSPQGALVARWGPIVLLTGRLTANSTGTLDYEIFTVPGWALPSVNVDVVSRAGSNGAVGQFNVRTDGRVTYTEAAWSSRPSGHCPLSAIWLAKEA